MYIPSVSKADILPNGCMIIHRVHIKPGPNKTIPSRGKITKMSRKSCVRLIVYAQATEIEFNSMMTLTYPSVYPKDGQVVKTDLDYILTRMRKQFGDFSYLWFLEFQQRGAPHIHILTSKECVSPKMRASLLIGWVSRVYTSEWFIGDCPIGNHAKVIGDMLKVNSHERVWEIIRVQGGARHYVTKYAAKAIQKAVPKDYQNVGRFWGCSRDVKPIAIQTIDVTDEEVRQYLDKKGHPGADFDVIPRFIFGLER